MVVVLAGELDRGEELKGIISEKMEGGREKEEREGEAMRECW